jgi:hypothetical protein
MKNLIFGMIATVMFLNSSFGQSSIKYSDYGFYHNEALSDFTKKYGENQKEISFIVDEGIKLMQTKYPEIFKDVNNVTEFDHKKIWNTNKEEFYKNNKIPRRVGDIIDKIVNANSSYDEAIVMIDDFEKSNKLTLDEANGLIAIKSVLVSSNQYWTSNVTGKHRPGSATLIADFAGAGMFMFAGPVAAICGFACSYLTHQNDR